MNALQVVHKGRFGFVTDFGDPITLKGADGATITLPRYGVWQHDFAKGKAQVVLTCDWLPDAIRACEQPYPLKD
jgi:hypothetical protein